MTRPALARGLNSLDVIKDGLRSWASNLSKVLGVILVFFVIPTLVVGACVALAVGPRGLEHMRHEKMAEIHEHIHEGLPNDAEIPDWLQDCSPLRRPPPPEHRPGHVRPLDMETEDDDGMWHFHGHRHFHDGHVDTTPLVKIPIQLVMCTGHLFMGIALIILFNQHAAGTKPTICNVIRQSLSCGLPIRLVVLCFLMGLAITCGYLCCIVPGIYLSIVLSLAPVILVLGDADICGAMCRSSRLMQNAIASGCCLLVITPVLAWMMIITVVGTAEVVILVALWNTAPHCLQANIMYYCIFQAFIHGIALITINPMQAAILVHMYRTLNTLDNVECLEDEVEWKPEPYPVAKQPVLISTPEMYKPTTGVPVNPIGIKQAAPLPPQPFPAGATVYTGTLPTAPPVPMN